jgi:hypothetical protein
MRSTEQRLEKLMEAALIILREAHLIASVDTNLLYQKAWLEDIERALSAWLKDVM